MPGKQRKSAAVAVPSARRIAAGRVLDRFGRLCLPLGVGLFFGYWISDFGVAWTPTMLGVLSVFFVAALLLILVGQWLKGRWLKGDGTRREEAGAGMVVRRRVVVLLSLAALAAGVRLAVYWVDQPAPLTRLDDATLARAFDLDTRQVRELDAELEQMVERLESAELFAGTPKDARRGLTKAEEDLLRGVWAGFWDNAFALDQIRVFYEDWYRFDPSRAEREKLIRSYLLTFDAELSLYEKSLRLSRLVLKNPEAVKFLDAPHPSLDLPEHTFSLFRQEFQGVRDQGRVLAGERYLRFLEQAAAARRAAEEGGFEELRWQVEAHLAEIKSMAGLPERAVQTVRADLQLLKRAVRRTWFPAQKHVAEWMGDIKFRRVGEYLITPEQVAAASEVLQPGDLLLGRKNWYLSNVGLPGFWPHAMLYLGPPEKLEAAFGGDEVRAVMEELTGERLGLAEALAKTFPIRWGEYLAPRQLAHGGTAPIEVLEALGEGVLLNTMQDTAGDYLAALRPRLGPAAKARAIFKAFGHLGKPYDFDFDFATDHALVCTEVVWRSYRAADGQGGLDLPLVEVAGRLTLPANEIARYYAETADRPDRPLDFVYFLDARERQGRAVLADEAAFRGTPERPKWDLAQK